MGKVETNCAYCGCIVYRHPYQLRRTKNTFCCIEHRNLWLSETLTGTKASERRERVTCKCIHCGNDYTVKHSKFELGQTKFCSLACKRAYNAENSNTVEHTCDWCGKLIDVSADRHSRCKLHFCDDSCFKAYKKQQNELGLTGKIPRVCPECGKEFEQYVCKIKDGQLNFCSAECRDIWRARNYAQYRSTPKVDDCKYLSTKQKEITREFFFRKCCICGKDESKMPRHLHVHHVYPDEVTVEYKDTYFLALCDSCHRLVHSDEELMMNVVSEVEENLITYKGSFIASVMEYFYGRKYKKAHI